MPGGYRSRLTGRIYMKDWTPLDHDMMRRALIQAQTALDEGEIPVGAVIVKNGQIIAEARNTRETRNDPTGHAELNVLREAAWVLGTWRMTGCTIYVTLEPCCMCASALMQSRIDRVIFGAYDRQAGGCGSLYRLTEDPAFNHYAPADGGLMEADCIRLINKALAAKR